MENEYYIYKRPRLIRIKFFRVYKFFIHNGISITISHNVGMSKEQHITCTIIKLKNVQDNENYCLV